MDDWHDGVNMSHEEIEACWYEMEVVKTCRPELIRRKNTGGLFGWHEYVAHDWMPSLLSCRWRNWSIIAVRYPLVDSGNIYMSVVSQDKVGYNQLWKRKSGRWSGYVVIAWSMQVP
jgi:hypothetical protein